MSQRPGFDLAKLSSADRMLVGGSLLLFIDSFLAWQRACTPKVIGLNLCISFNAWGGSGSFAGVLMALLALLLIVGGVAMATGVAMPAGVPVPTVIAGMTAGAVLFGIIKFLIVVGNHAAVGAWIGLILILVVAAGGYLKMQAERVAPPSSGFTG
jgi:hypothetical protein